MLKHVIIKTLAAHLTIVFCTLVTLNANSAQYNIDTVGMHGYIQFKVSHMGFSVLGGRFNKFDGSFTWDKDDPGSSSVEVTIHTGSLDSNHDERDKHLKSVDFLNTEAHPTATFKSTAYDGNADGGSLTGDFTLNGVTKSISIDVKHIGEGKDPWGGYRAGFSGETTINGSDYGYTSRMFPKTIDLSLSIEGIQEK